MSINMTNILPGMKRIEMFPDEFFEIQKELRHHPELMARLTQQTDKDIYIQMNEVAAYCNVVLDGDYDLTDMTELCRLCIERLQRMRVAIIITPPGVTLQ